MSNYLGPFNSSTDEPVDVDADYVSAVTTIAVPGVGFWCGVWPLGVYTNPIILKLDPAVFIGLMTGLGKTVANFVQQDGSPLALFFGQGPPAGTLVQHVNALSVNGQPCVSIYALDLDPWIVEGTIASVTAALTPPPFPPGGSGRVILEATTDPAGNILLQQSDLGLVLSPTAPHIPGQAYLWTLTGAVPTAFTILTASPAGRQTIVARQVAPGSPNFIVAMYRPSRTYSAGRCGGGGGVAPSLALQSIRTGVGMYDLTVLTTLAPVNFVALVTSHDPNAVGFVTYTGPATFSVEYRDLAGLPVDTDFSCTVTGIDDGTGNEGFEPLDDFMQLVIVQG